MSVSSPNKLSEFLHWCLTKEYNHEEKTIASGEDLSMGALLGAVLTGTPTADGGNTGDGVAGAVTFGQDIALGDYVLTCTAAAANAGTFEVKAPDGTVLSPLTVAAAYVSNHINLTVADGAADFVVGDIITIAVTEGDLKQIVETATDGTNVAWYGLLQDVDATAAAKPAAVLARGAAILNTNGIVWGATYDTQAKKDVALASLEKRDIINRTGV